ncbi:MAG: EamA family transporter [Candidatus Bathyarchaeota archaeon]|nr:MAG: EamA family transporter [Candidatus Bathyarchaeota archaeon]
MIPSMIVPPKPKKVIQGYVQISLASVLWGTMGVLAKLSFNFGIHPTTLIALRLVTSFAILSVALILVKRDSLRIYKVDIISLLALGILATALQRIAYFYAVDLTTVTVAAILFYTYPIFVTLSAVIFLHEKVSSRLLVPIVLTFLGAALVVRIYDTSSVSANLQGIVFGLLSSLLFALYFLMTKRLRRKYSGWTIILCGDGIGALVLLPVIALATSEIAVFPLQLWLLILAIALVPSLLAYILFSHGLKHVKASKGSILSVIEPLSAALFSLIILGESFEMLQILGVILALVGVVLLLRADPA